MCRRLAASEKCELFVYDIDPSKMEEFARQGATPTAALSELAAQCDLIFASLPNPAAARQVFAPASEIMRSLKTQTLILDFSTLDPTTSREISALLKDRGVTYIDAPVSGGSHESSNGTLNFLVGGSTTEIDRALPFLEILGNQVHYAGSRGAGSVIKLVNNVISMGINVLTIEAYVLGARAGVDGATLFNILQHCGGRSYWMQKRFPKLLEGDFSPRFTIDLAEKDLALAQSMADEYKMPMPVSKAARELLLMSKGKGMGGMDVTAVVQFLEELVGVTVRGNVAPEDLEMK